MDSKVPIGFEVHEPAYLELPVQVTNQIADKRVNQAQLGSSAVTTRTIGNIVESSHAGLGNALFAPTLLPASTTTQLNFHLDDNFSRTIDGNPDIALYTGITNSSQRTNDNLWPNAAFGMSNLPWFWYNNWGLTDNVGLVTSVPIRNNTVNDVPVVVAVRWRIIKNSTAALDQSQTS